MKPLRPLLLAPLLLLLTACGDLFAPSYARLSMDSIPMHALLTTDIEVEARGNWTIETNAGWLQASPSSGSGNGTVTLTAAAGSLSPGEYSTQIRVDGGDEPDYATVHFSFPRLRGNITVSGTTGTSAHTFSPLSVGSGPGTLLVGLRDHEQPGFTPMSAFRVQSIASQVATLGSGLRLADVYENLAIAAIEVDNLATAAATLSADPRVRYASPATMLEPLAVNDTHYGLQWSLETIGVEDAWLHSTGSGVRVAVIDVGFYDGHTDLSGNVADTYDFVADQSVLEERPACATHGTHVAGILAAEADNSEGVAGIAHSAELVLLNVGDDTTVSSECRIPSPLVVDALDWLLENPGSPKADIINLSLGGPWDGAVLDAVRAAYREGVTVIAASGNDELSDVLYPAAFPEVLAISATDISDDITSYSTTGPEVFLSAPGGDSGDLILSTIYDVDADADPEGYGYMGGTSMASPAVAAVAALLKSFDSDLTPVGIAGILADSSRELGAPGRDDIFGYGRLDAGAALNLAQSTEPKGFLVRLAGSDYSVPAQQSFDVGYVDIGEIEIEVSSNGNWNADLQEPGEYYGSRKVDTTGDPEVEVTIVVDQQ